MDKWKNQEYYLTDFIMMNNKFNVVEYVIEQVGYAKYLHFKKLHNTMDYSNKIDFSYLWLKEDSIKKLKAELHKKWFIRKIKLSNDDKKYRYLNPYLVNKRNKKDKELSDIFCKNETLWNITDEWGDLVMDAINK